MYNAKKLMTLQRNLAPRSKQPPTLPYELQKASIDDLSLAAQQLLQSTPVYDHEHLLERLVLAINSNDDDVKSRRVDQLSCNRQPVHPSNWRATSAKIS